MEKVNLMKFDSFIESLAGSIYPTVAKTTQVIRKEFAIEHVNRIDNLYYFLFGKDRCNDQIIKHTIENKGFKILHHSHELYFNRYLDEGSYLSQCKNYMLSFYSRWKDGFKSVQVLNLETKQLSIHSQINMKEKAIENSYFNSLSKMLILKSYSINEPFSNKLYLTNYDYPHIGHNLWNGLSGWSGVNLDRIACLSNKEIEVEMNVKSSVFLIKNTGKIELEEAIGNGYFPFHLKNNYISRTLIKENFLIEPKQALKNKNAILISLRTGNRSAINQFDFIKSYISKLSEKVNNLEIFIDGMNLSDKKITEGSHSKINASEEYDIAERLKAKFNQIRIINLVGCTIKENLDTASMVSFVLAPWGAGLAKTSWILDKPTFCYSNKLTLSTKSDLRIYDDEVIVESNNKILFLKPDLIFDIGNDEYRNNFYILDGASDIAVTHTLKYINRGIGNE